MVRHRQAEAECASSGFSAVLLLALIGLIAFGAYQMLIHYERAGPSPGAADGQFGQTTPRGAPVATAD